MCYIVCVYNEVFNRSSQIHRGKFTSKYVSKCARSFYILKCCGLVAEAILIWPYSPGNNQLMVTNALLSSVSILCSFGYCFAIKILFVFVDLQITTFTPSNQSLFGSVTTGFLHLPCAAIVDMKLWWSLAVSSWKQHQRPSSWRSLVLCDFHKRKSTIQIQTTISHDIEEEISLDAVSGCGWRLRPYIRLDFVRYVLSRLAMEWFL